MRKYLEKRYKALLARREELQTRSAAAQTADEVRSCIEELQAVDAELAEVKAELDASEPVQRGATVPDYATRVNGGIAGAYHLNNGEPAQTEQRETTVSESLEYRSAFRQFVVNGTPIPAELRAGDAISTTDTQAAIPLTIVREIMNTVRVRYGNLYRKVRKLAVQGGVEFPVGALEANFHWITEKTVAPTETIGALGTVSFKYHTAEIRIAQSFLSSVVTLPAFEAEIARQIVIAYMKLMDIAIVKGTGNGQPLGLAVDPRVTNVITMTAAQIGDWKKWVERVFASIVPGYRGGEFIMSYSTVDKYLRTMADNNNRPLYYEAAGLVVNDMDDANPSARFYGHEVSLVENTVLPDFDTANSGDVIGIYWIPEISYGINENYSFTMRRYFNEETNEWIDKALVVVDGKVLNPASVYLIKKAV